MIITYKKIVAVAVPVIGLVLIHSKHFAVLFLLFRIIMVSKIQHLIAVVIGQKVAGRQIHKIQTPEYIMVHTGGHLMTAIPLPPAQDLMELIQVPCTHTLKLPVPTVAMKPN